MSLIYETSNFEVTSEDKPLVSRTDGGHIVIAPKINVEDRTKLTPTLAIELMYLTMITGEAMEKALNKRGIDIGRINYQDNGNWGVFSPEGPSLHVHLYGRARSAKIQKYGEACKFPFRETGFYNEFEPLTNADISEIRKQIESLMLKNKYQLNGWGLI